MRELFWELFAYVSLFKQTPLQGEYQPSYEQVHRDIAALLEQQKATAKRQGIPDKDYHDACFAVVAWADETILAHSTWKYNHQWNSFPLQREYYQTNNAGEEFFERLEKLSPEQKEIREIYYLCLGLGFSGRYFLGLEDELQLTQIRRAQAQRLTLPLEHVQNIDRITAQPYQITPPVGKPIQRPLPQVLLKAGLALLIALPLVCVLLWLVIRPSTPQFQFTVTKGGSGSGLVTSLPDGIHCGPGCAMAYTSGTRVTLKATPDPGSVFSGWSGGTNCTDGLVTVTADTACTATFSLDVKAVEKVLADPPCAKISVGLPASQAGAVELGGRVMSEGQGADVRKTVQNIKGVTQVKDKFDIIARPFCNVLDLLEPFKKQAEDQGLGSVMSLNKPGSIPDYSPADILFITNKTPAKFDFIYVDYYAANGMVGHLSPSDYYKSVVTMNRSGPNTTLAIGPLPVTADPPGRDLVTVIASKVSLFPSPRPDPGESAEAYINVLRQVLSKDALTSDVTTTFHFLRTRQ